MIAEHLLVGILRRAHGISGECWVEPTTDRPEAVYAEGRRLLVGSPEGEPEPERGALTVAAVRPQKRGLLVRFTEILDRSIAESFRGYTLLIPRAEAEPTEAGEYFVHDLVGLLARGEDGEAIGRVLEVYEVGSGHLLGIAVASGEQLLPFTKGVVRDVDLERGTVTVAPPEGWPV